MPLHGDIKMDPNDRLVLNLVEDFLQTVQRTRAGRRLQQYLQEWLSKTERKENTEAPQTKAPHTIPPEQIITINRIFELKNYLDSYQQTLLASKGGPDWFRTNTLTPAQRNQVAEMVNRLKAQGVWPDKEMAP